MVAVKLIRHWRALKGVVPDPPESRQSSAAKQQVVAAIA